VAQLITAHRRAIGSRWRRPVQAAVARDLADYLWLMADGFGPCEAVEHPDRARRPNSALRQIAEQNAPARCRSAHDVIAAAKAEFPTFENTVNELCR